MARPKKNVLAGRTADIAYAVGGLTITVEGVQAVDAVVAAAALLEAAKSLPRRFPELIEGVSAQSTPIDQIEEVDDEDYTLAPTARRRVGFHR